jgi:hypothetical protein
MIIVGYFHAVICENTLVVSVTRGYGRDHHMINGRKSWSLMAGISSGTL